MAVTSFRFQKRKWDADTARLLDLLVQSPGRYAAMEAIERLPVEAWKNAAVLHKIAAVLPLAVDDLRVSSEVFERIWNAMLLFPEDEALLYSVCIAVLSNEQLVREYFALLVSRAKQMRKVARGRAQETIVVLNLIDSTGSDFEDCVRQVISGTQGQLNIALALLGGDIVPLDRRIMLLSKLIAGGHEQSSPRWRPFIVPMRRALDSRKSGLTKAEMWEGELELPLESFDVLLPVTG